ncbi:MAG: deoxyguanosinetriphosphate triphosphohydrolase [Acidimicrobiaceae bacterium]|nr:deoxyguanosinetriphosphate triphosphohydrolase [Acidimicrobiaceae bacterium]
MEGHAAVTGRADLTTAHHDSHATIGPVADHPRHRRDAGEELPATEGATRASGGGDRAEAEEPDPFRTCFERDRDRILHATAFRRLAGKTQVFVFPEDHQRSRLTHALEVAQVARAIATRLGLNVPLAEAIALGHDCGHGPGGHASEDALSPYVDGGYDHAQWGADVTLAPLNLCTETLDGIRNHSWSRPAPSTPEGEVVSWADRIAYVCHDFEDAAYTGIVDPADLPALVLERCGATRREQLAAFIDAVVSASVRTGRIGMDADVADALAAFRTFDYERIYLRPASVNQADRVLDLLRALVDHYLAHPDDLPADDDPVDVAGSDGAVLAAVRYVGGMTDRFACRAGIRLLGLDADRLPTGLDVT